MPRLTKEKLDPRVKDLAERFKKDGVGLFRKELPRRIELLTALLQEPDFSRIKIDDFALAQDIVDKLDRTLAAGGDQLNRCRKRKVGDVSGNSGGGGGGVAPAAPAGASAAAAHAASAAGATPVPPVASSPATSATPAAGAAAAFATEFGAHTLAPMPSNARIVRMLRVLKEQYTDALETAGTLKMWIQLNVPRIEDGNNFGVDVQTECITELSGLEDKICSVLESTAKYFSGRAKLLTKCVKHPDVDDYRRSIEEVDHMECINIKICIRDLQRSWVIIYDMMHKNFDRLEKPKGEGAGMAMY